MNAINYAIQKYLQEKGTQRFTLKAVLFDMDGVIYDSMPNHATSWVKVMRSFGFNMSEEEAYMHEGRKGDDTINIVSKREGKEVFADDRKQIYRRKTEIFGSCPEVLPMKGIEELLRLIAGNGLGVMLDRKSVV